MGLLQLRAAAGKVENTDTIARGDEQSCCFTQSQLSSPCHSSDCLHQMEGSSLNQ